MKQTLEFKGNTIYNIGCFERLYTYYNQGHFFSKDTMRFFRSKVLTDSKVVGDSLYFITSEQGPDGVRRFTLRQGKVLGDKMDIDTVGSFQGYATRHRALKALKEVGE